MKKCSRCKQEFPSEEFTWKNKEKGQRHYRCKICIRENNKEWYQNNKEKVREKTRLVRNRNRAFALEHILNSKCVDCGESDPVVLEFDHIKGIKKFNISTICRRGCAIATIVEEIKKCVVRCANCHRRKTAKEQSWYSGIVDGLAHLPDKQEKMVQLHLPL